MKRITLVCLALAAAASLPQASAQSMEARLRQQLVDVTAQLHQVQDDQAALQAKNAAAEKERDSLKKQLAAAQAELSRYKNEGGPQSGKLKAALDQAASTAQQATIERDQAQDTAKKQGAVLAACQAKNDRLYKVAKDILKDSRFCFDLNARTTVENALQDYGDAVYDSKFDPRVPVAPPAGEPKSPEQVPQKP